MKILIIFLAIFGAIHAQNSNPLTSIMESIKPAKEIFGKIMRGGKVEGSTFADSIQNSMDAIVNQMTPIIARFREIGQIGLQEIREIFGDPRSIMKSFMSGMRSKRQTKNESNSRHHNSKNSTN